MIQLVLAIVRQEVLQRVLHQRLIVRIPQRTADQHPCAIADVCRDDLLRQWLPAKLGQHGVDRVRQIEPRIDQRPVQIEDNQANPAGGDRDCADAAWFQCTGAARLIRAASRDSRPPGYASSMRKLHVCSLLTAACLAFLPLAHAADQSHFPSNEDLRHVRSMTQPKLSPDGKQVLLQVSDATADGGKSHLWLIDIKANTARQLTYSSAAKSAASPPASGCPTATASCSSPIAASTRSSTDCR